MLVQTLQTPRGAAPQRQRQSVRACAAEPARASLRPLDRRAVLSWLPLATLLSTTREARAADFEAAKKPDQLEYTTLEASYKEKDETVAGDVGRFAGARRAGDK